MTENFSEVAALEGEGLGSAPNPIVQDYEELRFAHRVNFERINSLVDGLNSVDIIGIDEMRIRKAQIYFAEDLNSKFQLSESQRERLSNLVPFGLKDSSEDLRIESECKAYDDSIRVNPMNDDADQKLRQRIGHAILSGKPEELEAVVREHRPRSGGPGRIDVVMQRVKEDFQKKGIYVDYGVATTIDYAQAAAILNLPISELKAGQAIYEYNSCLVISKGNQSVRVSCNKDGVVSSSAFVSSEMKAPLPKVNESPEEAAERFKIFLSQLPRQFVDPASLLREISK
jgi:hypothetical protein